MSNDRWLELGFSLRDWDRLPTHMKRKWWDVTRYGANPPSKDLADKIRETLDARKTG